MCKCSARWPNQEAAGTQGQSEDMSVCGTEMFLQCGGRLQRNCDDFLRESRLLICIETITPKCLFTECWYHVEKQVKLLQCTFACSLKIIRLVLHERKKQSNHFKVIIIHYTLLASIFCLTSVLLIYIPLKINVLAKGSQFNGTFLCERPCCWFITDLKRAYDTQWYCDGSEGWYCF